MSAEMYNDINQDELRHWIREAFDGWDEHALRIAVEDLGGDPDEVLETTTLEEDLADTLVQFEDVRKLYRLWLKLKELAPEQRAAMTCDETLAQIAETLYGEAEPQRLDDLTQENLRNFWNAWFEDDERPLGTVQAAVTELC